MYGVEQYIKQEIKKPFFSEMYYTVSVAAIATRTFTNQPVNLIYVTSLIIQIAITGGVAFAGIVFTDNYNRSIFSIQGGLASDTRNMFYIPLNLFIKGNTITISALPIVAGIALTFSIGYQTIQDLA